MFLFLVKKWHEETGFLSNLTTIVENQSYQLIIGMGEKVIPSILRYLQEKPDWLGPALTKITGECPIPDEIAGRLKEITECWIQWGKDKGYIK